MGPDTTTSAFWVADFPPWVNVIWLALPQYCGSGPSMPLRASFVLFREHCISVQALQRGKSCRRLSLMERKMEIRRMRRIIVSGWAECAVPLLQRSRFWTLQSDDSPSYLDVGMHRDELASIADGRVTVDRRWTADTIDQCLIVAVAREGGSLFPIYVCIHRV